MDSSPSDSDAQHGSDQPPPWVGYWRVRRYGGADPPVPTFYDATEESWDVIKDGERGLHVARHPILKIKGDIAQGDVLVLKDEGTADEAAEAWHAEVEDGRLYVEARTGPHEDAVGVADRIGTDPRELISEE